MVRYARLNEPLPETTRSSRVTLKICSKWTNLRSTHHDTFVRPITTSWFLDSYSRCIRGDMSGRVGDLSVKQAEALAQVNYYSFIPVKSMSWIYLLRVLGWNILPIREATLSADGNSRITLVLNAESIDFYQSTKVLVNRSFAELCKWRSCWSLQCGQHVNRCC